MRLMIFTKEPVYATAVENIFPEYGMSSATNAIKLFVIPAVLLKKGIGTAEMTDPS